MLTDLKGVIDINVIIVGGFSTLLSTMDRSFRRNINKKTLGKKKKTLDLSYT